MSKARIWEKNDTPAEPAEMTPNPRIMRFLAKQATTFSTSQPVDTFNTALLTPDNLPKIERKGAKKVVTKVVRRIEKKTHTKTYIHYVSYQLRCAFDVLNEDVAKDDSLTLSFITVNLSKKYSDRYRKLGATGYGKKMKALFKRSLPNRNQNQEPSFFVVLEESCDGTLHSHLIMRHHIQDENQIADLLRTEAKPHNNSVEIKHDYIRWLDVEPGSTEWDLHELDMELPSNENLYPYTGLDRNGNKRFYGIWPLDVGAADYMSKELHIPITTISNDDGDDLQDSLQMLTESYTVDNKHYIEGDLKQRMKARYDAIRESSKKT